MKKVKDVELWFTPNIKDIDFNRNKTKKQKNSGITLIALVITIIILLILAEITINLSLGENGIFRKAKEAKNEYLTAQTDEEEMLNELYKQMGLEGELPENTEDTEAGTLVKAPNNWSTNTPNIVTTTDGSIVEKTKVATTVYAVADGEGNTVPVPIGFYYVGGSVDTGVVISDNEQDKYEKGKDKTIHEYAGNLKGNQFVWIPCKEEDYHKIDWEKENAKWDIATGQAESIQIEKYNGFYVGRYEAGVGTLNKEKEGRGEENPFDYSTTFNDNASLFNAVSVQSGINGWIWQNYNFTARTTGMPTTAETNKVEGNVVIKANSIPYFHADYYTALEMSKRLYKENKYVKSDLVTGTEWDMMIKFINERGDKANVTSSDWGNYTDTTLENCTGWYCQVDGSRKYNTMDKKYNIK